MRSSARSPDDGDVIRARLRALLAETQQPRGWVPEDGEPAVGPDGGAWDDSQWDDGQWDDGQDDEPDGSLRSPPDAELPAGLGRHRAPGRTARLDPGRPGAWALWAVAVLAAAAVVGWTWLGRPAVDDVPVDHVPVNEVPVAAATGATAGPGTPSATSAAGTPTARAGTVVVSVIGQVAAPGLVTLPSGSRVADALSAVGGLLPDADPASVNAAAVLTDGQQIAVGVPGAAAPSGPPDTAGMGSGGVLDLNAATVADLDALPGIGPVLAQRIVDHRTAHGPFTSVDQLDEVSGIGPAIFADLATRVRV